MTQAAPVEGRVEETGRTVVLRGGRRLGYAEFGAAAGVPVVYCHGFPASRLEARLAARAASACGVRLIAPDRPGYGLSDFQPDRAITDWADDVAQLADALGIARFGVLGVSGGGPYALACAVRLGGRLSGVAVVCGLGPAGSPAVARMNAVARFAFVLARRTPALALWFVRALARVLRAHPRLAFTLVGGRLPRPDLDTLADPAVCEPLTASLREALRQGGRGAARDLLLFARDWGFSYGDVAIPCWLWHGIEDTTVPVEMGRDAAREVPGCRAEFAEHEGHFSIIVRRMEHILATLADPRGMR